MKKKIFLIKFLIIYFSIFSISYSANQNYYDEAKALFDKNEFDKSKFLFEKDIVFNPKNEKSYLHLAKIFNKSENDINEELNLNNVLLLNPNNDEALYMLILLKIKHYDYDEAKNLIQTFDLVCDLFCSKQSIIDEKFNKLSTENVENKN